MSLFDRIFGKKEQELLPNSVFQTLSAYTPVFTNWNGSIYESALVRAAIECYASHVSKMSVKIYGAARPTLQTKLKAVPNDFQTWSQFLARLTRILMVNNTAFIVPVVDNYDNTIGVYPILPTCCELTEYNGEPYVKYRFSNGKCAAVELPKCGVVTRFQYSKDFFGDSNNALSPTMSLMDIQNQGIKEGVKSSATYRFMARVTNFSKSGDLAKERERFSNDVLSADNNGGFLLFPNTYDNIQQIKSTPFVADADQMKVINTNVYNYFGVSESIMQNTATAEELDSFYNGALEPIAIQLSEVLTKMLFSIREQASGAKVVVSSDRLQYMSVQNKISLLSTMGDRGMITINEARALLNYEAVDGGDELMPIRGEYYNATESEVNDERD